MGGNGQGKTSLLEAVYYLCTTKSFYAKDNEAVSFENDDFEIKGYFKNKTEDISRIYYSMAENRKYYFQNEKLISRNYNIIGKYPVVLLAPSDHSITQGSPADRRRFVDSVISQASSTYLNMLIDYNKTIKHRAVVLNKIKEFYSEQLNSELEAWTERLIENGVEIIKHRNSFVNQFNEYLKNSYLEIMNSAENPSIKYLFLDNEETDIRKKFCDLIDEKRNEEIRRGINLVGPHRDEFEFTINNISLKTYGSQGQHKTFQAALRFAEFFYLKEITSNTPIFLLDDAFGELDAYRAGRISQYLKKVGQAFITITDFADFSFLKKSEDDLIIKLQNGVYSYAWGFQEHKRGV